MMAMTCEKLEAILPDYFEGDLTDEAKAAADAHLNTCAACAAIVADIHRISQDAATLPPMRPSRDLWSGIEERISAPVIPLAKPAHPGVRRFASLRMAAAAAALIVTTAGVTYLATARMNSARPVQVAQVPPMNVTPVTAIVDSPSADGAPTNGTGEAPSNTGTLATPKRVEAVTNSRNRPAPTQTRPSVTLASSSGGNRSLGTRPNAMSFGSAQAEAQYAHEITTLEAMIDSPNSGLDSATVQVVKRNLKVIDDAIAQSKAALAKDPASPLLYDQVTRAMGKKVELLRTMASLSSSE